MAEARHVLNGVEGIKFIQFSDKDVVRHPLVQEVVRAYDAFDLRRAAAGSGNVLSNAAPVGVSKGNPAGNSSGTPGNQGNT
jgi:phosphate starvation-inducible PhoH-like protein